MPSDTRKKQLEDWLSTLFKDGISDLRPASSDASFRRYFRFNVDGESYIVMDAPPEKEDTASFLRIARRFSEIGLHVPRIVETDSKNGFLLLGDLGSDLYLPNLNHDTAERLYGDALGALVVLQKATPMGPDFLPLYSEKLLRDEMELFRKWHLKTHLSISLSDSQNAALDNVFNILVSSAQAQPQVWVHRDFHSRNLMLTKKDNPGILDFQDAVLGPVTYDLVSLLRDCYISWPLHQVHDWVFGYHQLALQSGIPVGGDEQKFLTWFDYMGVQRHLKASGIFARLCHRDGKNGYLKDIPRTLGYVMQVCRKYPELSPLAQVIDDYNVPYDEAMI